MDIHLAIKGDVWINFIVGLLLGNLNLKLFITYDQTNGGYISTLTYDTHYASIVDHFQYWNYCL